MDGSKSLHEKWVLHHLKLVVSGSRILHNGSLRWSFRPRLLKQTYPNPNAFANSLYQETTVDAVGSRHSKLCKEMQVSYLKSASYLLMVEVLHEQKGIYRTIIYGSSFVLRTKISASQPVFFFRSKRMELTNSRFYGNGTHVQNRGVYWVICHWRNLKVPGELTNARCYHGCNQATSRSTCHMAKAISPEANFRGIPHLPLEVSRSFACFTWENVYHPFIVIYVYCIRLCIIGFCCRNSTWLTSIQRLPCMLHWPTYLLYRVYFRIL